MSEAVGEETARGRQARRPSEVSAAGWRDILIRAWRSNTENHVSLIAGSVAFYGLLALFPALGATIATWSLAFDPAEIEEQVAAGAALLPAEAATIVTDQARAMAASAGAGLTVAAGLSLLVAFFSASRGVAAIIEGLNIVYGERERRGLVKLNLIAIGLTIVVIVMVLFSLSLVAVAPALLGPLALLGPGERLITLSRWPVLAVAATLALALLYRFGPSRAPARWRWISWGAAVAVAVWLLASIGFSLYVRNFSSYNEAYGSLGAVIVLMLWFWITSYVMLLGAVIDCELERQTTVDTTTGAPKPMGERGAYAADSLGEQP